MAGQPLHGLEIHLQMGKFEAKCFKVFVPPVQRGQTVGDLALAQMSEQSGKRGWKSGFSWLRIPSEPS